jgi:hypothetical protein
VLHAEELGGVRQQAMVREAQHGEVEAVAEGAHRDALDVDERVVRLVLFWERDEVLEWGCSGGEAGCSVEFVGIS